MRALVLGGGGPIGVAWESGLVAGLAEQGVQVAEADLFVGTSAGSVVGSQLALGKVPQLYERQIAGTSQAGRDQRNIDMSGVIAQFIKLYSSDRPQDELRAEVGALAFWSPPPLSYVDEVAPMTSTLMRSGRSACSPVATPNS